MRLLVVPSSATTACPSPGAGAGITDSWCAAPHAQNAEPNSQPAIRAASTAVMHVTTRHTAVAEPVFNLKVESLPEFFANGILTHNCDFVPDFDRAKAGYSPDRMDALVWAATDLMLAPGAGEPSIRRLG
jgi:phage terminase large subunit-like protein